MVDDGGVLDAGGVFDELATVFLEFAAHEKDEGTTVMVFEEFVQGGDKDLVEVRVELSEVAGADLGLACPAEVVGKSEADKFVHNGLNDKEMLVVGAVVFQVVDEVAEGDELHLVLVETEHGISLLVKLGCVDFEVG